MKMNWMVNTVKIAIAMLGFCITGFGQLSFTSNGTQTIDFNTTISGVNNGTFDGTGFTPTPGAGQIDSDAFAITGFSDGSLAFGGTRETASTDYTRGETTGGITSGGLYAYTPNPAIYIQPGGSDFTPGDVTLRIQNNGTSNIQQLRISYDILVLNDQARANSFNFSFSFDDSTYFPATAVNYTSPEAADQIPVSSVNRGPLIIGGLNIVPGAFFYIRWTSGDVSGSGSRDELGLDNIAVTAQFEPENTTFTVLNEIEVDNPSIDDNGCEYIEVRGDANSIISERLFLLEIDGDGSAAGIVDTVIELQDLLFGSNGLITVSGVGAQPLRLDAKSVGNIKADDGAATECNSRDYASDGSTYFTVPGLSLENGSTSYMLVTTQKSTIDVGDDFDTDNNGTLDNLPFDATIVDAVGWLDSGSVIADKNNGTVTDYVYGGVDATPGNTIGGPDGATRNFENITPFDPTAWFADDLIGSFNSVLYDQTNLLGGYRIDFITPGRQNLAPNAANGIISGKVRNSVGQGIGFVTLKLSGGTLQEPIYRTTNHFGNFSFNDISVGQSYILEAMSGRNTFQNPNRVINLDDSITNVDFVAHDNKFK